MGYLKDEQNEGIRVYLFKGIPPSLALPLAANINAGLLSCVSFLSGPGSITVCVGPLSYDTNKSP